MTLCDIHGHDPKKEDPEDTNKMFETPSNYDSSQPQRSRDVGFFDPNKTYWTNTEI